MPSALVGLHADGSPALPVVLLALEAYGRGGGGGGLIINRHGFQNDPLNLRGYHLQFSFPWLQLNKVKSLKYREVSSYKKIAGW